MFLVTTRLFAGWSTRLVPVPCRCVRGGRGLVLTLREHQLAGLDEVVEDVGLYADVAADLGEGDSSFRDQTADEAGDSLARSAVAWVGMRGGDTAAVRSGAGSPLNPAPS
jgi:hypothetical protein